MGVPNTAVADTRVSTAEGIVSGVRGRRSRRGTVAWRGIPYAAPPVGGGRFDAPQPVAPWPGVRPCENFGDAAIQDKLLTATGLGRFQPVSEDCLTLNVVAPDTVASTPRPVMVFIHGGAYILGTAATPLYDGTHLARAQDVVVVTIQYRFGPFGMLDFSGYSTPERHFDENPGLKDHIAALQWVQRNIAAFGGDPDNVTIFGESAGGTSVLCLLAAPGACGLFHRAIAESPATDLAISRESAALFADEYLRLLLDPKRRSTDTTSVREPIDPHEAARILDAASPEELHRAGGRLMGFARHADSVEPTPFGPVYGVPSLPQSPYAAARDGNTAPVPLIIGTNRDEGKLFDKFWNLLPDTQRTLLAIEDETARDEIMNQYAGGADDQLRLSADSIFWAPVTAFADAHREVAPTYVYRFDFHTRALARAGLGATHATELFAVFGGYRMPVFAGLATADWRAAGAMVDEMQSRWGDFARGRRPGPDWPVYDAAHRPVMVLDRTSHVESDPDASRRQAWDRGRQLLVASGGSPQAPSDVAALDG